MIKINLLHSVTERQNNPVVSVEKKVANPMTRLALMAIAVFVLTVAVIGWDFISASQAKTAAQAELENQQKKSKELEAMVKEQKELETKIKNIDQRIDAIKKLRNSQAGPSAVLEAIRERIMMTPEIYLESVDQKGDQLTIKGSSPNESAVTDFGRSLEFSSGLFSNLSIETQRQEVGSSNASAGFDAPRSEVINFTIRCSYTPDQSNNTLEGVTTADNLNSGEPQNNNNKNAENPPPPPGGQSNPPQGGSVTANNSPRRDS